MELLSLFLAVLSFALCKHYQFKYLVETDKMPSPSRSPYFYGQPDGFPVPSIVCDDEHYLDMSNAGHSNRKKNHQGYTLLLTYRCMRGCPVDTLLALPNNMNATPYKEFYGPGEEVVLGCVNNNYRLKDLEVAERTIKCIQVREFNEEMNTYQSVLQWNSIPSDVQCQETNHCDHPPPVECTRNIPENLNSGQQNFSNGTRQSRPRINGSHTVSDDVYMTGNGTHEDWELSLLNPVTDLTICPATEVPSHLTSKTPADDSTYEYSGNFTVDNLVPLNESLLLKCVNGLSYESQCSQDGNLRIGRCISPLTCVNLNSNSTVNSSSSINNSNVLTTVDGMVMSTDEINDFKSSTEAEQRFAEVPGQGHIVTDTLLVDRVGNLSSMDVQVLGSQPVCPQMPSFLLWPMGRLEVSGLISDNNANHCGLPPTFYGVDCTSNIPENSNPGQQRFSNATRLSCSCLDGFKSISDSVYITCNGTSGEWGLPAPEVCKVESDEIPAPSSSPYLYSQLNGFSVPAIVCDDGHYLDMSNAGHSSREKSRGGYTILLTYRCMRGCPVDTLLSLPNNMNATPYKEFYGPGEEVVLGCVNNNYTLKGLEVPERTIKCIQVKEFNKEMNTYQSVLQWNSIPSDVQCQLECTRNMPETLNSGQQNFFNGTRQSRPRINGSHTVSDDVYMTGNGTHEDWELSLFNPFSDLTICPATEVPSHLTSKTPAANSTYEYSGNFTVDNLIPLNESLLLECVNGISYESQCNQDDILRIGRCISPLSCVNLLHSNSTVNSSSSINNSNVLNAVDGMVISTDEKDNFTSSTEAVQRFAEVPGQGHIVTDTLLVDRVGNLSSMDVQVLGSQPACPQMPWFSLWPMRRLEVSGLISDSNTNHCGLPPTIHGVDCTRNIPENSNSGQQRFSNGTILSCSCLDGFTRISNDVYITCNGTSGKWDLRTTESCKVETEEIPAPSSSPYLYSQLNGFLVPAIVCDDGHYLDMSNAGHSSRGKSQGGYTILLTYRCMRGCPVDTLLSISNNMNATPYKEFYGPGEEVVLGCVNNNDTLKGLEVAERTIKCVQVREFNEEMNTYQSVLQWNSIPSDVQCQAKYDVSLIDDVNWSVLGLPDNAEPSEDNSFLYPGEHMPYRCDVSHVGLSHDGDLMPPGVIPCCFGGEWTLGETGSNTTCVNCSSYERSLDLNKSASICSISSGNLSYLVDNLLFMNEEVTQWWKMNLHTIYTSEDVEARLEGVYILTKVVTNPATEPAPKTRSWRPTFWSEGLSEHPVITAQFNSGMPARHVAILSLLDIGFSLLEVKVYGSGDLLNTTVLHLAGGNSTNWGVDPLQNSDLWSTHVTLNHSAANEFSALFDGTAAIRLVSIYTRNEGSLFVEEILVFGAASSDFQNLKCLLEKIAVDLPELKLTSRYLLGYPISAKLRPDLAVSTCPNGVNPNITEVNQPSAETIKCSFDGKGKRGEPQLEFDCSQIVCEPPADNFTCGHPGNLTVDKLVPLNESLLLECVNGISYESQCSQDGNLRICRCIPPLSCVNLHSTSTVNSSSSINNSNVLNTVDGMITDHIKSSTDADQGFDVYLAYGQLEIDTLLVDRVGHTRCDHSSNKEVSAGQAQETANSRPDANSNNASGANSNKSTRVDKFISMFLKVSKIIFISIYAGVLVCLVAYFVSVYMSI